MAKVSNEDIYAKLVEIEDILKHKEHVNLRFGDINEWRMYVWEGCPYRVEKVTDKEIDFYCKILKGPCEFPPCPRNQKDSKYA